jgi:hypothetical protein
MQTDSEIEKESSSIVVPIIGFFFLTLVCIIFYKYNEILSRINLIHFVIMCLVTFLLFYIKIKIMRKGEYTDVLYIIIFLFVYSFIK